MFDGSAEFSASSPSPQRGGWVRSKLNSKAETMTLQNLTTLDLQ